MPVLPNNIIQFLQPFSIVFHTNKTFVKLLILFSGSLLCQGGRTVCACLRALGMHGEKAFSNYHHVLNRCKWSSLKAAKVLIKQLLPFTNGELVLIVDEHLERRNGAKIKTKSIYRDAVSSSASWLVKCWGIKWVVLSCLIKFPWSTRSFALPFFCVIVIPKNHKIHKKRKYRTGIDIICQMLYCVRKWLPQIPINLVGDGEYAKVKLAKTCIKLQINLIARMRVDARLHDFPGKYKGLGRYPKIGLRLTKKDIPPQKQNVAWYGGRIKEVRTHFKHCLWQAGKSGTLIPVFAGWVQLREDDEFILVSVGGSSTLSAKKTVELYISRWNLEVTFRECREYLGIQTQRQWSDLAITRTSPLIFGSYTLVTIIGHFLWKTQDIIPLRTAWYNKQQLTFSDMLQAVRKEIWKHRSNSGKKGEFEKVFTESTLLYEYLSAADF